MSIVEHQIHILKKIKKYLGKTNLSKIDIDKSSLCYFVGWDISAGLSKIRTEINLCKFYIFLKIYLRDLIGIGYQNNYQLINLKKKKLFNKMILTWSNKKNFKKDGSFYDSYFKINSKKMKNTIWVVIYMDFELPNKIDDNIIILKNISKPNFSFFYFFKTIFSILIKNSLNIKKIFHYSSLHSNFGDIVLKNTKSHLLNKNLNKIIMPYEAQPFQQMVIAFVKKNRKKIKVLGYIHDCEPLSPNLMYKKNSPNLILLPGKDRKKYFSEHLNWPINSIKIVDSFRYYKSDFKNILKNQILLPSGIYDIDKITNSFESFISSRQDKSLKHIKVRSHPASTNQKLQKKLKEELERIIKKYKKKFSNNLKNKNSTIIIGITSLLVVALENGYKVTQICMDPKIQSYSNLFSPNIKTEQINENVFSYSLKKFGGCLKFGKKNSIKNYL